MLRDLENILTEVACGSPVAVAVAVAVDVEKFWIAARTALPIFSANADSFIDMFAERPWPTGECTGWRRANMTDQSKCAPLWLAIVATGHKSRILHKSDTKNSKYSSNKVSPNVFVILCSY